MNHAVRGLTIAACLFVVSSTQASEYAYDPLAPLGGGVTSLDLAEIPEPATLVVLALGALAVNRRKRW